MTNTTLKSKSNRLNVSLSMPTAIKLSALQKVLIQELGFEPSITQVVEYLINTSDILTNSKNVPNNEEK